jgi:hypothetical protein
MRKGFGGDQMRTLVVALMVFSLAFSSAFAVGGKPCDNSYRIRSSDGWLLEDVDFDVRDGSIVITNDRRDREEVEITSDYKLYVNGRLVVTNEEQDELLADYYDLTMAIIERAKKIGLEGAEIGVSGAAIGVQAVGGILKALLTEYEFEDLEYDLEVKAEELEEKAEKLERKADRLEHMADQLADVHDDLRRETPELRELRWF